DDDAAVNMMPATDAATHTDAGMDMSPCREGMYLADYTCNVDNALIPLTAITLQSTLMLQRTTQTNVLTLVNSALAFDYSGFLFGCTLSGQLDCTSGAFHADMDNGVFAFSLLPVPVPFTGSLDGTLDRTKPELSGSWTLTSSGASCTGTWTAPLQP